MAETSFPVLEQPLTDQQWKSVTLGIGDGVLDEGGNPYALSRSNQTDQVTIAVDTGKGYNHAILKGFYHRMDAAITLSTPAVTSKTTYTVALQYDPTRAAMPVKLGVFTTMDTSNGKAYLPLWTVERSANQLLSDATLTAVSPHITPLLQVSRAANLPDAKTVLFGTWAHCRWENVTYRAEGSWWKPVTASMQPVMGMGGWSINLSGGGFNAVPTSGGFMCTMAGWVQRTAETYTVSDWSTLGTMIPSAWRPASGSYCIAYTPTTAIGVRLSPDGQIDINPLGSSFTVRKGNPIHFQLSWFTSTTPTTGM